MGQQRTRIGLIFNHLRNMLRRGRLYTEDLIERPSFVKRAINLIWPRRSIFLRHLDSGSCNGCELELAALENPVYDIKHLGIEFKASPRHADVLVMTGPFTRNLAEAAELTLKAMPKPWVIIAVGDCAAAKCAGDDCPFAGSYALVPRPLIIEDAIKVRVKGCPPPQKILSRGY